MRACALRALALAFVVAAAAGCGSAEDDVRALPPGSLVSASGAIDPSVQLFGDTVHAAATVVVDNGKLNPGRVQLKAAFAPYKQVGPTQITRRTAGDLTELDYDVQLRCLDHACITESIGTARAPELGAPRSFRFAPASVLYTDEGKKEPRLLRTIRWPTLQSASRINGQDVTQIYGFPFRSHVVPLPALSYRVSPTTLAVVLLLLAAILLVLPMMLVARRLRRKPPTIEEPEPELSPLERALRLVEWSRSRVDPEERRAALEALAAELDAIGDTPLANDTRASGWRPPFPDPDEAGRLVLRVREAHGSVA